MTHAPSLIATYLLLATSGQAGAEQPLVAADNAFGFKLRSTSGPAQRLVIFAAFVERVQRRCRFFDPAPGT